MVVHHNGNYGNNIEIYSYIEIARVFVSLMGGMVSIQCVAFQSPICLWSISINEMSNSTNHIYNNS